MDSVEHYFFVRLGVTIENLNFLVIQKIVKNASKLNNIVHPVLHYYRISKMFPFGKWKSET
jgi:hypothetical protein